MNATDLPACDTSYSCDDGRFHSDGHCDDEDSQDDEGGGGVPTEDEITAQEEAYVAQLSPAEFRQWKDDNPLVGNFYRNEDDYEDDYKDDDEDR